MISRQKAIELRKLIVEGSKSLTDEDALKGIELFPKWTIKSYEKGDRVRYEDALYKCLQNHEAQETWNPKDAVSLWTRVDDPSIEYPEWVQPESTNPYMKGDKVSYQGKHYISLIDNNVWSPVTYGWEEVL